MKPLILITNDDGIDSPGLFAAAEAVQHLGDLLIVAPISQQTTMGRSFPKAENSGIIEKKEISINNNLVIAYGVYGSPAQSVAHAVIELAERKPDLCISGINYGENLGLCISCSGTIGAAFEADSHNIPAIAVSLEAPLEYQHSSDFKDFDWDVSKRVITMMATKVLSEGFPHNISVLNVNVPQGASKKTPIKLTRQSRLNYFAFEKPNKRDYKKPFMMGTRLEVDMSKIESDSDVYALYYEKAISITPLTWNQSVVTNWHL